MSEPAPGWYPNPDNTDTARFWDGTSWTDQIRASDADDAAAETPISPGPEDPAGIVPGGTADPAADAIPPPPPPPTAEPGTEPGATAGPGAFPTVPPPMPPPPAIGLGPYSPPASSGVGSPYAVGAYPAADRSTSNQDGMAISSLVLGAASYPLLLLCWLVAIPAAITAVVLGIVAVLQANQSVPPRPKGMATAGLALGAGALLLSVLLVLVFLLYPALY